MVKFWNILEEASNILEKIIAIIRIFQNVLEKSALCSPPLTTNTLSNEMAFEMSGEADAIAKEKAKS